MLFSQEFRLSQIAQWSPEALVVLLHDDAYSLQKLNPVAERWAMAMPGTVFETFKAIEQPDPRATPRSPSAAVDIAAASAEFAAELDRSIGDLEAVLQRLLRARRLEPSQLVLVGFGFAATVALHTALRLSWNCAGALVFGAILLRPLPRALRMDQKIRLIECTPDGRAGHASLRDDIGLLAARGIDARGAVLKGSTLSDESVRHGGAYLAELVANAQRSGRWQVDPERQRAQ